MLSATARLGPLWESLVSLYIPSVVKLLGRANKLYVTRASGTLRSLIRNTRCSGLVALLAQGIDSPSVSLRLGSAEAVLCCLGGTPEKDVGGSEEWEKVQREGLSVEKAGLDKRNALALGPNGIEGVVRKGGTDKDPKVRSMCKRIWEIYRREWPDRAAACVHSCCATEGFAHKLTQIRQTAHADRAKGARHRQRRPSPVGTLGSLGIRDLSLALCVSQHFQSRLKAVSASSQQVHFGGTGCEARCEAGASAIAGQLGGKYRGSAKGASRAGRVLFVFQTGSPCQARSLKLDKQSDSESRRRPVCPRRLDFFLERRSS